MKTNNPELLQVYCDISIKSFNSYKFWARTCIWLFLIWFFQHISPMLSFQVNTFFSHVIKPFMNIFCSMTESFNLSKKIHCHLEIQHPDKSTGCTIVGGKTGTIYCTSSQGYLMQHWPGHIHQLSFFPMWIGLQLHSLIRSKCFPLCVLINTVPQCLASGCLHSFAFLFSPFPSLSLMNVCVWFLPCGVEQEVSPHWFLLNHRLAYLPSINLLPAYKRTDSLSPLYQIVIALELITHRGSDSLPSICFLTYLSIFSLSAWNPLGCTSLLSLSHWSKYPVWKWSHSKNYSPVTELTCLATLYPLYISLHILILHKKLKPLSFLSHLLFFGPLVLIRNTTLTVF